jgi:hypothetical protein
MNVTDFYTRIHLGIVFKILYLLDISGKKTIHSIFVGFAKQQKTGKMHCVIRKSIA